MYFATLALFLSAAAAQDHYTKEDTAKLRALQYKIDEAIDKGVRYLIRTQNRDGSWSYHVRYSQWGHIGITALSLYAMIKSDVPLDHPAIRRGMVYLKQRIPPPGSKPPADPRKSLSDVDKTYEAGCVLMAFGAASAKDKSYLPWMQPVLKDLISWQGVTNGIWGYGGGSGSSAHPACGAADALHTHTHTPCEAGNC